MKNIDVNELCNEAGKMRKFFKAFEKIDEVLIGIQNSDAVLNQLEAQIAEKESELSGLNQEIKKAHADIALLRDGSVYAKAEVDSEKANLQTILNAARTEAEEKVKQAKDSADKEIKEIRAYVQEAHVSSIKLANDLEESKKKAQKVHDAVIDGLKAEELRIEEKIKHGRAVLEDLKAKLSLESM